MVLDNVERRLPHLFPLPEGERERRVGRLRGAVENGKRYEVPDEPWRFRTE